VPTHESTCPTLNLHSTYAGEKVPLAISRLWPRYGTDLDDSPEALALGFEQEVSTGGFFVVSGHSAMDDKQLVLAQR
jgi:hypothetical protein